MTTGINPPDPDDDDSSSSTGAPIDETTTGGSESTSSDEEESGAEESSTTADPGDTFPCDFPTTCDGAGTLGGVAGDANTPPLTGSGSEPTWLQVQVSENDSGVFANDMEVTIELVSRGADFDLRAYRGNPGDTDGCAGAEQRSETAGTDTITFTWGESGTFANNSDDSTFVAVEIFPKEGVCMVGASWALTVTGDTR